MIYHPDKSGSNREDDAIFLKVQTAYETLLDPKKRRSYMSTEMDPSFVCSNYFDREVRVGPEDDPQWVYFREVGN